MAVLGYFTDIEFHSLSADRWDGLGHLSVAADVEAVEAPAARKRLVLGRLRVRLLADKREEGATKYLSSGSRLVCARDFVSSVHVELGLVCARCCCALIIHIIRFSS